MTHACATDLLTQRRQFWTTVLKRDNIATCGNFCGVACLEPNVSGLNNVSFTTTGYVESLILNILLTDGVRDATACGVRPGNRGGHWADSFRDNKTETSGTLLRMVPITGSIRDAINLVRAYVHKDLQKLVTYGVVKKIVVEVEYLGNNKIDLTVTVTYLTDTKTAVNILGERTTTGWIWV